MLTHIALGLMSCCSALVPRFPCSLHGSCCCLLFRTSHFFLSQLNGPVAALWVLSATFCESCLDARAVQLHGLTCSSCQKHRLYGVPGRLSAATAAAQGSLAAFHTASVPWHPSVSWHLPHMGGRARQMGSTLLLCCLTCARDIHACAMCNRMLLATTRLHRCQQPPSPQHGPCLQ